MPRTENPRHSNIFGTAKILRSDFAQNEIEIEPKTLHELGVAIPPYGVDLGGAATLVTGN